MKGKSLALLMVSLLLVLGLGEGIGGLWAREPEAPGEAPLLAEPVGTAFTYQGRLIKDGSPVDGTCDFGFTLWDSLGFEPIALQSKPGVIVTDGLFTVELDFGAGAFQGDARWLEITVRCPAGSGFYTPLSPHQALTAAPYALYALEAADLTCSQCVDAPEVGFYYAGSPSKGGPALDLSCSSACISSGEIENGAVTSAKIQDGEVSATDLEDGAALAEILDDDGSGSGLDADLLDGQQGSAFASASHDHWGETWTGSGTGLTLSGGSTGLYGSGSTYGVYGSGISVGVYGESSLGYGLYGESSSLYGVYGSGLYGVYGSGTSVGVYGHSSSGYGVYYQGGLAGTGSKSAIVETEDYAWRHLYAMESPEVWFEDFGTAQLVEGQAVVAIEPIFAQTVNLSETYHVFLTPLGDCGLFVADKSPTSFTVQALGGQTCNIAFDYRIIAKRLGYEAERLEPAEDPSILAQELEIQQEGP